MRAKKDFDKAMELYEVGKYKLAHRRFEKVADENPDCFESRMRKGDCLRMIGNAEGAHSDFNRCKELDPDHAELRFYSGDTNLDLERYQEAIDDLEFHIENRDGSLIFENATELLADAYYYLSKELFEKMDVQKARMAINSAWEHNPEDPYILMLMGNIYAQMEERDKALEYYAKGSKLDPDNGAFHYNMGSTYQDLGNEPVAKRCFSVAEKLGYDPAKEEDAF